MIICAVDIGIKNPAYSVFYYDNDNKMTTLLEIRKSDWSKDWERSVVSDITKYNLDVVILEKQGFRSPNCKFIHFIKGFFYNTNTKVIVRNPTFKGDSYIERKKKSVSIFMEKLSEYTDNKSDILSRYKKLDDIADSFNLGLHYLDTIFKTVR